tara:strand:- start:2103 stop:2786 length:684 start_codon:yes stop_codon:yes gene_type:complete
MNYESILNKYEEFGDRFLFTKNSELFIFCDRDRDLITKTTHRQKLTRPKFFMPINKRIKQAEIDHLVSKVDLLIDQVAVDTFFLETSYVNVIKQIIKKKNATHLRFFSDNEFIRVNVFDYRKFSSDIFSIKEQNLSIATLQIPDKPNKDFSFTISSNSFNKVVNSDYEVEVLENKRIKFISLVNTHNYNFYFRDQEFKEPIINFNHEKLNKEVSLLYQPSKKILNTF